MRKGKGGGIPPHPEVHGVAEAQKTGKAQQQVKGDRKECMDGKIDKHIGEIDAEKHRINDDKNKDGRPKNPVHCFIHHSLSPKKPMGLIARTTAIKINIRTGAS